MVGGEGEREDDDQDAVCVSWCQDRGDDILRDAAHTWQVSYSEGGICHGKEGGVHGRYEEGLGCREDDLRGESGLDGVDAVVPDNS